MTQIQNGFRKNSEMRCRKLLRHIRRRFQYRLFYWDIHILRYLLQIWQKRYFQKGQFFYLKKSSCITLM